MSAELLRHRADFLARYRWGLAFGIAIAVTFVFLPLRPVRASLAYDLIPAAALGAVWVGAGVLLRLLGAHWARRASAVELPMARAQR